MSFYVDDADEFFNEFKEVDENGDLAVILWPGETREVAIEAIFDDSQEYFDTQQGQFINAKPQIICVTSEVTDVVENDNIMVQEITYYAKDFLNDGTGITTITLSVDR